MHVIDTLILSILALPLAWPVACAPIVALLVRLVLRVRSRQAQLNAIPHAPERVSPLRVAPARHVLAVPWLRVIAGAFVLIVVCLPSGHMVGTIITKLERSIGVTLWQLTLASGVTMGALFFLCEWLRGTRLGLVHIARWVLWWCGTCVLCRMWSAAVVGL